MAKFGTVGWGEGEEGGWAKPGYKTVGGTRRQRGGGSSMEARRCSEGYAVRLHYAYICRQGRVFPPLQSYSFHCKLSFTLTFSKLSRTIFQYVVFSTLPSDRFFCFIGWGLTWLGLEFYGLFLWNRMISSPFFSFHGTPSYPTQLILMLCKIWGLCLKNTLYSFD